MHNHEPKKYLCPFCRIAGGIEDKHVITRQSDIVFQNKDVTAFISSHWWPNNPGHVIIIPNRHFENIFSLPDKTSSKIHELERKIALSMKKAYKCTGVSSRQHNEPDGGQEVWHYHLHIFPRFKNDNLYKLEKRRVDSAQKTRYAEKLKRYLK